MRKALGLWVAALLLVGCEDNKLITPPPTEAPKPTAPTEAAPTEASPPPAAPKVHGATGVGDTEPAPERGPPKPGQVAPTASEWGRKSDADGGTATDAGAPVPRGGPRPGAAKGPGQP
ncbi:hypothetical protein [Hyalangium gracile]|uniref:hypothetical protein n=1 Tax=Hyalangium gracile TaxID=394092 RepID=UPI001CCCB9EA|nr:hypothetical protein [Hyalangium gracile]